jgi:broad specificity phosphatase PhoE
LTVHGFQQATRLGQFFCDTGTAFTHIFSSSLQRAYKTAELVRSGQDRVASKDKNSMVPEIVCLDMLMEQNFGSYEGVSFTDKSHGSSDIDTSHHTNQTVDVFIPPESTTSMQDRMDSFLDLHLLPLLRTERAPSDPSIAIISHGIILSVLWRRLLLRLPPNSVTVHPSAAPDHTLFTIEHLGHWKNTGYLELEFLSQQANQIVNLAHVPERENAEESVVYSESSTNAALIPSIADATERSHRSGAIGGSTQLGSPNANTPIKPMLSTWRVLIKTINGNEHLKGLRRTKGGIGSSKYDASQKSIYGYFTSRGSKK